MKLNKLFIITLIVSLSINCCFAIVEKKDKELEKLSNPEVLLKGTTLDSHAVENLPPDLEEIENETPFKNDIHSKFSLDDCLKIAIEYNPIIRASIYDSLMQKSKIGQAWAGYFPTLSLGVQLEREGTHYSRGSSGSVSFTNTLLPTLSAQMPLFDFGKIKATADTAKMSYQAKEFKTKENINVLIYELKKAYYNVLFAQAQVKVYEDTVKDYELQRKRALRFYETGKKAKIDVITADYNLGKAQLNLVKARNVLAVANVQLVKIMGIPEYTNYELTSQLGTNKFDVTQDIAIKQAFNVRPELLVAQKTSESAKMNLRANRRKYTPTLGAFAGLNNGVGSEYNYFSYQFGVGLTYNELNIMKVKKQIDEAKMSYKKSIADLDDVKHNLYLKVKSAYLDLKTAEDAIIIAKLALDQATEQYRQASGRYSAGVGDYIELKDGETTYLTARLDFYNSLLNYNITAANLEKEIGIPLAVSSEKVLKTIKPREYKRN